MNRPPKIIEEIVSKKTPCFFVSPHLDDAVLSAGGLISYLAGKTRVEVVTVFTEADDPPYTLSAKAYLSRAGVADAHTLFCDRRNEDEHALAHIGVRPTWLGFVDGLWRKPPSMGKFRSLLANVIPEFAHVYPIFRVHITANTLSSHDTPLMMSVGDRLRAMIGEGRGAYVFCPLAIDTHIDHVFVREVCAKNFPNIFLWGDQPYRMRKGLARETLDALAVHAFNFFGEKENKEVMIREYKSQVPGLYQDGKIPHCAETYFSPRNTIQVNML